MLQSGRRSRKMQEMDPLATRQQQRVPCILLVGISEAIAERCAQALDPFPVLRAPHAQAALARMPIVRPTLVVLDATWGPSEIGRQLEVATAVGARAMYADGPDDPQLVDKLRAALAADD